MLAGRQAVCFLGSSCQLPLTKEDVVINGADVIKNTNPQQHPDYNGLPALGGEIILQCLYSYEWS